MDLETVYLQTNYIVYLKSRKNYAILKAMQTVPKSLEKFLQARNIKSFAYITPCNPCSVLLSRKENGYRVREFMIFIEEHKLSYLLGVTESSDKKWNEISFCILGISYKTARRLAFDFSQNAFLYASEDFKVELKWTFENSPKG